MAHWREISSDLRKDISQVDKAKLKGWMKVISTGKFHVMLAFFRDVVSNLAVLSRVFQEDAVSLPSVIDTTKLTTSNLEQMVNQEGLCLSKIFEEIEEVDGICMLKLNELSDLERAKQYLSTERNVIIAQLLECLSVRFRDFHTNPVMVDAARIIDPSNWPIDSETALTAFGVTEVKNLLAHFKDCLIPNGCDVSHAVVEWKALKMMVKRYFGVPTERRNNEPPQVLGAYLPKEEQ